MTAWGGPAGRPGHVRFVVLGSVAAVLVLVSVVALLVVGFVFRGDVEKLSSPGYSNPDTLAALIRQEAGVTAAVCVPGEQDRTMDCSVTFDVPPTDLASEVFPRRGVELHTFRVSDDGKTVVAIS
jgi:hypothetical protein